jgi:hypothetical protein
LFYVVVFITVIMLEKSELFTQNIFVCLPLCLA